MSFRTKRIIVCVGLVVMVVWPPVHHVIVRATELSAWKGAGWSMYCVPNRAVAVRVDLPGREGRPLPLGAVADEHAQALRLALGRFQMRRAHLGRWARPDGYAAAIFRALPGVDRLTIEVGQAQVDRETAMCVEDGPPDRYEYRRER